MFTQIPFGPSHVAQCNLSTVRNESRQVCMPRYIPHPPALLNFHTSLLCQNNNTYLEFLFHLSLPLFPFFLLFLFLFLFLLQLLLLFFQTLLLLLLQLFLIWPFCFLVVPAEQRISFSFAACLNGRAEQEKNKGRMNSLIAESV